MVEVNIPDGYPFQEGHQPEVRGVLLDLYRLTMIYLGDRILYGVTHSSLMPEWATEDWEPVDDPLWQLSSEFQWTEITRILISSAAIGRVLDDRDQLLLNGEGTECGTLIPDLDDESLEEPLSLREAFNKIIHANKIRSDFATNDGDEFTHLNPVLYFYGSLNNRKWKAKLFVSDYVRQYFINLSNA